MACGRMSARFVASNMGMSTSEVYDLWKRMGLVFKDSNGWWCLTKAGENLHGHYSKNGGVPTFIFDEILPLMMSFGKKHI